MTGSPAQPINTAADRIAAILAFASEMGYTHLQPSDIDNSVDGDALNHALEIVGLSQEQKNIFDNKVIPNFQHYEDRDYVALLLGYCLHCGGYLRSTIRGTDIHNLNDLFADEVGEDAVDEEEMEYYEYIMACVPGLLTAA